MAFDEQLASRIRRVLGESSTVTEKRMFGGLAFMVNGNMCCGIVGDELMARVGPGAWEDSLAQPHAREMDFTGRSLKGYVYVGAEGTADDTDLAGWVGRARGFVLTLPPKV